MIKICSMRRTHQIHEQLSDLMEYLGWSSTPTHSYTHRNRHTHTQRQTHGQPHVQIQWWTIEKQNLNILSQTVLKVTPLWHTLTCRVCWFFFSYCLLVLLVAEWERLSHIQHSYVFSSSNCDNANHFQKKLIIVQHVFNVKCTCIFGCFRTRPSGFDDEYWSIAVLRSCLLSPTSQFKWNHCSIDQCLWPSSTWPSFTSDLLHRLSPFSSAEVLIRCQALRRPSKSNEFQIFGCTRKSSQIYSSKIRGFHSWYATRMWKIRFWQYQADTPPEFENF